MSSRGKTFSKYPGNSAVRRLDRIECPHCGMAIIPRLAFYDGTPTKSVCPFCAGIVRDFRKPTKGFNWLRYLLAGLAFLIVFHLTLQIKYGPGNQAPVSLTESGQSD